MKIMIGDIIDKLMDRKKGANLRAIFLAPLAGTLFSLAGHCIYLENATSNPKIDSRKIENDIELVERLEEEKGKLQNIKNYDIKIKFTEGKSCAKKIDSDKYEISLNKDYGRNVNSLRHELFHIAASHHEQYKSDGYGKFFVNGYNKLFNLEPSAIEYARLELK